MLQAAKKLFTRFQNMCHRVARYFAFRKLRKLFRNREISVFSSNCVGSMMLHDLGVAFRSPFVGLFLDAKDYIRYLRDPQKYNALEFTQVTTDLAYPVGRLGDLTFHFVHYASFEEAVAAFERRAKRICYDDVFVIFSERDGCTYRELQEFDALPYPNKIVFTHLPYEDIRSAFYIEGFENEPCLGNMIAWDRKLGKRIYDRFDFVSWFSR